MITPWFIQCPYCAEPENTPCIDDDGEECFWVEDAVHAERMFIFILIFGWRGF